jgi:hypothetical protein
MIMNLVDGVVPTIELLVSVPGRLRGGNGWAWVPAARFGAVSEYVYSSAELCSAMRGYGRTVASMLMSSGTDGFTVTGRLVLQGNVVGRDQWNWDPELRMFRPHGEPWSVWRDETQEAPAATGTGGATQRQGRFVDVLRAFSRNIGSVDGITEHRGDSDRDVPQL